MTQLQILAKIINNLISSEIKADEASCSASTHFNQALVDLLKLCPGYEESITDPEYCDVIELAREEVWLLEVAVYGKSENQLRLGEVKELAEISIKSQAVTPGLTFVLDGHQWGESLSVAIGLKGRNTGHFSAADNRLVTHVFVEAGAAISYCEAKAQSKPYGLEHPFIGVTGLIRLHPEV